MKTKIPGFDPYLKLTPKSGLGFSFAFIISNEIINGFEHTFRIFPSNVAMMHVVIMNVFHQVFRA